ncbi:hypothetical protein [Flavobacterium sediminis]|uniref:hypothetical protein n=1 Tax=Flavobacterium sediminis TaxID=2201181 RepID=UPI0014751BAE|nr:hypothetical protein [Flavobacterium sediminis]
MTLKKFSLFALFSALILSFVHCEYDDHEKKITALNTSNGLVVRKISYDGSF